MNNSACVIKLKKGRRVRLRRWRLTLGGLAALTLILAAAMLTLGRTVYPASVVLRVLLGDAIPGATFAVMTLRLPRMLSGVFAGVAFGMAGSIFQTMLRNPLASPDIIGVASGASVAAVICILVFRLSGIAVSAIAMAAGLVCAAFIYALSGGGAFAGGRLILIGIGVSAMQNAVISYLMFRASQYDIPGALRWLSGNLNGIRLERIPPLIGGVVVFGAAALLLTRRLALLELGDETASALGVSIKRAKLWLTLCAVFLAAIATSSTGPIAFVAFLSGPIAKRLAGTGASPVLPAAFTGASLVLAADLLGQFAFDTKFPVGVITGILGAPYLLFLLVRINRTGD
ncbi:MAG: iron chelate uptake ABC transporter family permease subunit [Spirochaetaceae bacterium]|jgi:iron complex transport system permease protein|nr:iron chelate uptake ABC transporter family permease subunit [Spirochaetaceae bacterium]